MSVQTPLIMTQKTLTAAELERLAFELGVSATRPDGKVINAERVRKLPPLPEPDPLHVLAREIKALAERPVNVEVTLPDMPAPKVVMTKVPADAIPKRWTFEIERDGDGLIQRITAMAD